MGDLHVLMGDKLCRLPDKDATDQGSILTSAEWAEKCKTESIELSSTGTESHNSLGAGETYHAIVRRVFNKACETHSTASQELQLALAVKASNDTAGPNGLVPSVLFLILYQLFLEILQATLTRKNVKICFLLPERHTVKY